MIRSLIFSKVSSRLAVLAVTAALAGCAVGPKFSAPAAPTERAYLPESATAGGPKPQSVVLGETTPANWWTLLGSPEVDETVQMALANNWSLAAAQANLAKAGQIVKAAQGGLYPQVDAAGGAKREAYGAYFLGPEAFTFPTFSAYTGGIGVSYDLDVFGGTRRRIELAAADDEVEAEALNAARLAVAGGAAITVLRIAAVRAEIDTVQAVIDSDQKTLNLVDAARRTGVASDIDITTAQSQLDRDRARLPPLQQQIDVAGDALATLVGKSPATWTAPAFDLAKMTLPVAIPLAVPSRLVRARPDIRAAEARLHAANAEVGITTADLYPKISLSAGIAQEGLTAGPAGTAWSLVGGVAAPVFHGGALTARRRASEDAYQAALAQYQQTVLAAFQQVADALHGLDNAADAVGAEQKALDSANAALRLIRLGYGVGNAGIVQVLDAQRLQQLAELNLVQAQAQRYVQTVNLFMAAGGGLEKPSGVEASAR